MVVNILFTVMIVVVIYLYTLCVCTGISFPPQHHRRSHHNLRLSTNEKAVSGGFCKRFIVLISLKSYTVCYFTHLKLRWVLVFHVPYTHINNKTLYKGVHNLTNYDIV